MTKGLSSLLNLNPDGLIKVLEDSVSHLDHIVIITNNPNIDKDGLKILSVNSAFCRISGFSKSEVIGLKP
jgi:PAS domain-containing protein